MPVWVVGIAFGLVALGLTVQHVFFKRTVSG